MSVYKVYDNDLGYEKSLDGIYAHSIFAVNALTVIQEHFTNNLRIYNNGQIYKTFKGLGASAPRSTI